VGHAQPTLLEEGNIGVRPVIFKVTHYRPEGAVDNAQTASYKMLNFN